jgi:hypothetical protein
LRGEPCRGIGIEQPRMCMYSKARSAVPRLSAGEDNPSILLLELTVCPLGQVIRDSVRDERNARPEKQGPRASQEGSRFACGSRPALPFQRVSACDMARALALYTLWLKGRGRPRAEQERYESARIRQSQEASSTCLWPFAKEPNLIPSLSGAPKKSMNKCSTGNIRSH